MRKLATASLSFAAAAALWQFLAPDPWLLAAMAAPPVLGAVFLRGDRRARALIVALGFCAGSVWCAVFDHFTLSPAIALDGETEEITFRVTAFPDTGDHYTGLRGRLVRPGRDIPMRLRLDGGGEELRPGDEITITATLYRADEQYGQRVWISTADGIFLRGYAWEDYVLTGEANPIRYFPQYLSRAVQDKIDAIFPAGPAGFVRAILTGDRSGLDDSLYENLRVSGTAHVVAVSGMHVSFLVTLLVALIGRGRRASLAAIIVVLVFMGMTGATPSVVRAGTMQILLLAAPLLRRESDNLTSLALALLLILITNPHSIAGIGLQLSFLSVVGLVTVTPRVYRYWRERVYGDSRLLGGALRFIGASIAASLGAVVFTLPVTAYHFGTVSLYAPLSNLLVVWAASMVFAGGLLACLAGFLFTPLGGVLARVVSLPVYYIQWVTAGIARFPLALIYTYSGYIRIWLAGVYAVVTVYLFYPGEKPGPALATGLGGALLIYCLFLGGLEAGSGELTVTALDVGQGQSILLSSPNVNVLVDCGGQGYPGDTAVSYLYAHNISRLDFLVITHYDADHVSGVEWLLTRMPVDALAVPDGDDGEKYYRDRILALAEERDIPVVTVKSDTVYHYGTDILTVFAPLGSAGDNERGLSVLMTSGDFDVLITGDMSSAIERRLVQLHDLPDIEVLVVGHHGSKFSTSEELIEVVLPEVAIISVGGDNSYGHPSPEVLARLDGYGTAIYRTDLSGRITVRAG